MYRKIFIEKSTFTQTELLRGDLLSVTLRYPYYFDGCVLTRNSFNHLNEDNIGIVNYKFYQKLYNIKFVDMLEFNFDFIHSYTFVKRDTLLKADLEFIIEMNRWVILEVDMNTITWKKHMDWYARIQWELNKPYENSVVRID